jgi:hypothetical protein
VNWLVLRSPAETTLDLIGELDPNRPFGHRLITKGDFQRLLSPAKSLAFCYLIR